MANQRPPEVDLDRFYDVVIIGAGPAGLAAGLYLARACYRVALLEKEARGGLINIVNEIVNYPGIMSINGAELLQNMRAHAEKFGIEFLQAEATALLDMEDDIKTVATTAGDLQCYSVLLATGAPPKLVGFKGETAFRGRGIAYTAAVDGEFFTGKEIFIVGAGTTAAEDSVFLTKYASHVTVLVPSEDFTCDEKFWTKALNHPDITVLKNTRVDEVTGDSLVRELRWTDLTTGEVSTYSDKNGDTFGLFIFTGHAPATGLVRGLIELDALYYVPVDSKKRTSLAGLYAAGDVCSYTFRQALTAAADGATAAYDMIKYIYRMQSKVGIFPEQDVKRAKVHRTLDASPGETGDEKKSLFSPEMLSQLNSVFMHMEKKLVLHVFPDSRKVSDELVSYMSSLSALADMLDIVIEPVSDDETTTRPYVRVEYEDGTDAGVTFHGMPGGNEFNSFILGIYNASCDGQALSDDARKKAQDIDRDVHMTIFVTLTCTMCPDLVTAAQRIATLNPRVTTDVYDLSLFPELSEKYNVISVPCYFTDEEKMMFGRKSVEDLLEVI